MSSGRKVLQCQKSLQCHKFTVTKSITISSYDIISDNNIWNLTFKTVMANFLLLLLKRNKKKEWKQWKLGGSKEEYQLAKKAASRAVYDAKQQPHSKYFQDINTNNDWNKIFKMA